MVMRANQDIKCGTELTVAYAGGGNHLTRGESLTHLLGCAICECKLCELDRTAGDEASRKRLEVLLDHDRAKLALIQHGALSSSGAIEIGHKNCLRAVESTCLGVELYVTPHFPFT